MHPELMTLMREATALKSKTYAVNTKQAYKTHYHTYLRFCLKFDLLPVPATDFSIMCYIAMLSRTLKTTKYFWIPKYYLSNA